MGMVKKSVFKAAITSSFDQTFLFTEYEMDGEAGVSYDLENNSVSGRQLNRLKFALIFEFSPFQSWAEVFFLIFIFFRQTTMMKKSKT